MRQRWEDYGRAAERGPFALVVKVVAGCFLTSLLLVLLASALGLFSDATQVVHDEFAVSALLKKYEWFKDASAALDKKLADIKVYEVRLHSLEQSYAGKARGEWPRDDREQYNLWLSEVAGVKASYNTLAADYNAQMSKANWRFTNVGDLPRGATEPLPREYKPYEEG